MIIRKIQQIKIITNKNEKVDDINEDKIKIDFYMYIPINLILIPKTFDQLQINNFKITTIFYN